jgi:hypothetical protein
LFRLKSTITPLTYAQFIGLLAYFLPPKNNRRNSRKNRKTGVNNREKRLLFFPIPAKPELAKTTGEWRRIRVPKFRSGVSGNPMGRPKGSKNLTTLITEAARDQVSVEIDGKTRKISTLQAAVTQLATKAARGDQKAMVEFLDRIAEIEGRVRPSEYPLGEQDVEVLRAAYQRMTQCESDQSAE